MNKDTDKPNIYKLEMRKNLYGFEKYFIVDIQADKIIFESTDINRIIKYLLNELNRYWYKNKYQLKINITLPYSETYIIFNNQSNEKMFEAKDKNELIEYLLKRLSAIVNALNFTEELNK